MEIRHVCRAAARLSCRVRWCSSEAIVVPARVERTPTDILKALATTVSRDVTAPHYKYHDDPFLIPSSNIGKRTFALAKESGRKAAQWIHQQHSEWFDTSLAQPPVPAFMPRAVYAEDTPVTEQDLQRLVLDVRVEDAAMVAQLLEKQGTVVSRETKQALLELLCFYNCEEPVATDLVEERWFRQGHQRERQRKTWKDGGLAEKVFASLQGELQGPEAASELSKACCTLLRGMSKFCQVERAWDMYQQMRAAGQRLDCNTFDSLIRAASFLKDSHEARWQLVEEVLREMAACKVKPGLGTLNAILEVCSGMGNWRQTRTLSLRCLAEFRKAGVTPSLASYYYLLVIFCRERGPVSNILEEILEQLEGQSLTVRDPKDTFFFVTAMDVCRNHLGDPALARRLHSLLHAHNNYDLIGDSYKESIYYRHFFTLLCTLEPLDTFLQVYSKYVPHIYIPEPSVMEEIVRSVQLHEAWDQLPRLWTDLFMFDQADRPSLVQLWLQAAVMAGHRVTKGTETGLAVELCRATQQLWEKVETQIAERRTNIMRLNGPMLGDMLCLAVRAAQFPFASQLMGRLQAETGTGAPPSLDALREYLRAAVELGNLQQAMACVEYAVDAGFPEAAMLAEELRSNVELSASQQSKLHSLLGSSSL